MKITLTFEISLFINKINSDFPHSFSKISKPEIFSLYRDIKSFFIKNILLFEIIMISLIFSRYIFVVIVLVEKKYLQHLLRKSLLFYFFYFHEKISPIVFLNINKLN